jgi:hypothetical protein
MNLLTQTQIYQIPLAYNLSDSQFRGEVQIDGSFWANSFVHGSNGHNYHIATHVMDYGSVIEGSLPIYRSAILDVTDPSYYHNFIRGAPNGTSFWDERGEFHATFENFGLETLSTEDPLAGLHAYCAMEGIEYDLSIDFSSPVLLNAALGSYWINNDLGHEWSLPRGRTSGWLKINGEVIEVDPELSSSWYDRQWGSMQDSFQWLSLHLEESNWLDISVLSVWEWKDAVNGGKEFATIRNPRTGHDSVVPVKVNQSLTNFWVSPQSGLIYPQEWTVLIDDIEIFVSSPRADQVVEAPEMGFPLQFSGYVEVLAKKAGQKPVKGYGAIDFLQPFP